MQSTYDSATRHYAELVERTMGKILQTKPFALWLEAEKKAGRYWQAPNIVTN